MAEPVGAGGYLLWVVRDREQPAPPTVRLELLGRGTPSVTVDGATHPLSPRHSELLALLALRRRGWSAEELADELLGHCGKAVSIRAELSRMRRVLGSSLASHPYRLTGHIQWDYGDVEACVLRGQVGAALRHYLAGELLEESDVPMITEARFRLTMIVREAVLQSTDPALLSGWLQLPAGEDDVQACRALIGMCPTADPRHALAAARLRRLSASH